MTECLGVSAPQEERRIRKMVKGVHRDRGRKAERKMEAAGAEGMPGGRRSAQEAERG